jgi:tetratricopeptide (TPR) repeat protein
VSRKNRRSKVEAEGVEEGAAAAGEGSAAQGVPSSAGIGAAVVSSPAESEAAAPTVRKVMLAVIVGVFVLFMGTVLLLFQSGESMQWKRELLVVDRQFEQGEFAPAAEGIIRFGKDWPDAQKTVGWNEKAGRYLAANGQWKEAAGYLERAVALDDANKRKANPTPRIRALAGEAWFKAGESARAIPLLEAELDQTSRANGDHDLAHYLLGLIEKENKRLDKALAHFQGIADRERYAAQIAEFYADLDARFLQPARQAASSANLQDLL